MTSRSGSLSSFLVARGAATARQVEEALARQVLYGGDLPTNLLEAIGPESENELVEAMAAYVGLPVAGEGELPRAPADLLRRIPGEVALRYGFSPLALGDGTLRIAVAEPLPPSAVQELTKALGQPLAQEVASLVRIRQALARDYGVPLDRRMMRLIATLHGDAETMPSSLPPAFFFATSMPGDEEREAPVSSRPTTLSSWVQAVRQERERKPRRRGPLTLAAAEEELLTCRTANEVLALFFDFSRQYFLFSSLFLLNGDHALLVDAFGPGADPDPRSRPPLPLAEPSLFMRAREHGAPLCQAPLPEGCDRKILHALKRTHVDRMLLVPVVLRGRSVALLYADDGDERLDLAQGGDVISMAARTSTTLENLMVRRKLASANDGGARTTVLSGPPPSPAESGAPLVSTRLQGAEALARALGLPNATLTPPAAGDHHDP